LEGRFSCPELLHPPGRRSGVIKAERRETENNPEILNALSKNSTF